MTTFKYLTDDNCFRSSHVGDETKIQKEYNDLGSYEMSLEDSTSVPLVNWKLALASNLRITYLNVEANATIEPLLENTEIALTFPSLAPSWRECAESLKKGASVSNLHTNSTSRISTLSQRNQGKQNQLEIEDNDDSRDARQSYLPRDSKICTIML